MTSWRRDSRVLLAAALLLAMDVSHGAEALGQALYTNCAACHGHEGQGDFGPPLAGNPNLQRTDYVIAHVLSGSPVMPAFRGLLSPAEIAAVVNYVRNSWGNRAADVSAADVNHVGGHRRT